MRIEVSKQFIKDLNSLNKGSKKSVKTLIANKLKEFRVCKEQRKGLPAYFKDHALSDEKRYKGCRECHLRGDTVLIYKEEKDLLILTMLRVGNHNNLLDNYAYIS